MDALQNWRAVKSHFEDALNAFHGACAELEIAVHEPDAEFGHPSLSDTILLEADSYIAKLEPQKQALASAHATMSRIRNTSTNTVLINRLPPEVLSFILSFSADREMCQRLKIENEYEYDYIPRPLDPLETLQLVCVRWRNAMLATPSLWSHVDVAITSRTNQDSQVVIDYTNLQIERAANSPLHLHFDYDIVGDVATSVAVALRQHLHRVSAITFAPCPSFVEIYLEHISYYVYQAYPEVRASLMGSYRGLVYLQLIDQWDTDLESTLTMLSCNPCLRFLSLVTSGDAQVSSAMVYLPDLEVLDILYSQRYHYLLSMLTLGTKGLDLRIAAPSLEEFEPLLSFIRRSNVKSLTLRSDYLLEDGVERVKSCISSAPKLEAIFFKCGVTVINYAIHKILINDPVITLRGTAMTMDNWRLFTRTPLFSHIKIIGIVNVTPFKQNDVMQCFDTIIAVCSPDLVVIGEQSNPQDLSSSLGLREWASKHGELVTIESYSECLNEGEKWELFTDRMMQMCIHD